MAKRKRKDEDAATQPAAGAQKVSEHSDLIRQLGADQEQAFKANKTLYEMVTRATAPGSESKRAELATALAAELTAKQPDPKRKDEYLYPHPVRVKVARLLSFVATEKEVPALQESLRDLDVREMARYALDFNTSEAATKALVMALADVGSEFRIGLVGALARRNSLEARSAVEKVASGDSDPRVQSAAADTLERHRRTAEHFAKI